MLVRIQLLQIEPQFLQQRAAIGIILEFLQPLPGDVERGVARHHVANEALARLPIGKLRDDGFRIRRQHQIGGDSALVNFRDAAVEFVEIRRIGPVRAEIDQRAIAQRRPGSSHENG